jgi:hypothetical protein
MEKEKTEGESKLELLEKEEVKKALLIKTYEELSTELQQGGYALLKVYIRD